MLSTISLEVAAGLPSLSFSSPSGKRRVERVDISGGTLFAVAVVEVAVVSAAVVMPLPAAGADVAAAVLVVAEPPLAEVTG